MNGYLNRGVAGATRRRGLGSLRSPIVVTVVIQIMVVWAPAAMASTLGWTTEKLITPPKTNSQLEAVSCFTSEDCMAVGTVSHNRSAFVIGERRSQSGWRRADPVTPPGAQSADLTGLTCLSGSFCMAVGGTGSFTPTGITSRPIAESWDGASWSIVPLGDPPPAYQEALGSVSCIDATHCVAVGGYRQEHSRWHPLAATWDGTSWAFAVLPEPTHVVESSVFGLSCPQVNDCSAVGFFVRSGKHTLAEHWDGSHWTIVPIPEPPGGRSAYLFSVSCPAVTWCMAVGSKGSPNHSDDFTEVWNGSAWNVLHAPDPPEGADPRLQTVSCVATDRCMAMGDSTGIQGHQIFKVFAERWDGSAWHITTPHLPRNAPIGFLPSVSCVGNLTCEAVGGYARLNGRWRLLGEHFSG
jgi:hypothetical protein